jgi:hypothetical protein
MSRDISLDDLIRRMAPVLDPQAYVFVHIPAGDRQPALPGILMRFEESEGTTLILPATVAAKAGLDFDFRCRRITLSVQSDLAAVGFMAQIALALGRAGISCNPVAGYFHDHVFVPEAEAQKALEALRELSRTGCFEID